MKDKVGNEITVGCWIAYGHALGRCAGLRIGKVMKLKEEENPRFKEWKYADPMISRITVRGIDDDWRSSPPRVNDRQGTLMFPNRILVLKEDQTPQLYKDLMDAYEANRV